MCTIHLGLFVVGEDSCILPGRGSAVLNVFEMSALA